MSPYIFLGFILFGYMNLWFFWSLVKKRNDVADVAWGLGFVLLAWTSIWLSEEKTLTGFITSSLVTIWGMRLAWHIQARHRNKPEDERYAKWREEWGRSFYLRSYFQVFLLQGFLLYLVSLPVTAINLRPGGGGGWFLGLGLCLWLFGFIFETVADWQLSSFLKKPEGKGKLMRSGLWSYSRHPNYFGEVTQWWGIWVIALSSVAGALTIIGPLTITYLILKVSGVPMLERKMSEHPDFRSYESEVSIFFPLPPRRKEGSVEAA